MSLPCLLSRDPTPHRAGLGAAPLRFEMLRVAEGEPGACAISKRSGFQKKRTLRLGLLTQTLHVNREIPSPQLGSNAGMQRGGKELPGQLLQINDYPCWWKKNRHYLKRPQRS